MKNNAEKSMWTCKTSDTPWTLSSLLKKAVCAVLPDTPDTVQDDHNADKNNNCLLDILADNTMINPAMLDISHPCHYLDILADNTMTDPAMLDISHPCHYFD